MQNARRGFSHGIPHDNEMLIKQDGNLQKRHYTQTMLHLCNILSFFVDQVSFLLIMSKFFGANTCIFCTFKFTIYNTMLHFSAYYDMFYCSWVDLFAIYMHILHICSTWKTQDGRKFRQEFWSFRRFRTK